MRVLHISRTMGQGGAEKVVFQLCSDNMADYQVVVSDGGKYVPLLEQIGIKHYCMPDLDSKNPFSMMGCFICILLVAIKERIDIIHTHHRMAAFYAKIISRMLEKKNIYTAHNVFYNKKKLTKFALSGVKIVAVGDGVKNNLKEYFEIDDQQIMTIYNSIKLEMKGFGANEIGEQHQKVYIGTIGRISEQKGIDVFIKAIAIIKKKYSNIIGVIVGDGELMDDMKSLVHQLEIDESILFLGYRNNVLDIINQLKFVVLASRWEGLPLTPIEAFSQGKTVIASNISGNNEIVVDGENGLLFEKDDSFALAGCIEKLIKDERLLSLLQINAFNSFEKKYSYSHFINSYIKIYRTL